MPPRYLLAALLLTATAQAAPPKLPITANTYSNKAAIDGKAGIHDYPWDYAHSNGLTKDPHGPDTQFVADGLILDGDAPHCVNQQLTQIAGTAVTLKGSAIGRLSDVNVHTAINGVRVDATDAQLDHVNVDNIVKDSITVAGGGNDFIDISHVCGG
jgi:formylmethanofuran dehydrogenase subunit B